MTKEESSNPLITRRVITRRALLRSSIASGAGLALLSLPNPLAAYASTERSKLSKAPQSGTGTPITTLRLPFLADMGGADPDVFYEAEGLQVTTSVYEGLVQYTPRPPDTPLSYVPIAERISPGLAESWEVSPDGVTYTFHLRPNVLFHDGTPMDAASWQASIARRGAVDQGPAYMVQPVAATSAPDALTLVVKLKHPVEPFLDYLACSWGPKAVSPTAVKAHSTKGDMAQKWLMTHDAGTGPYMLTEYLADNHYVLQAFPRYWGTKPQIKTVQIPILPDLDIQEIKLKDGDLDMITKGLPIQAVESFGANTSFEVKRFPVASSLTLYINPTKGRIFADSVVRRALVRAIDKRKLVKEVFGDAATVATQFYAPGSFPDGAAPDNPKYEPSELTSVVKNLSSKKVDLAYSLMGGAANQVMGELIQAELAATGLDVTVRGIPTASEYDLYNLPDAKRPDLLIEVFSGDAMNPDSAVRIFLRTGAAPLNWFDYSIPTADTAMDVGQASTSNAQFVNKYAQVAKLYVDADYILKIANTDDVFVSRAGITGFVHDPQSFQTLRIADLKGG